VGRDLLFKKENLETAQTVATKGKPHPPIGVGGRGVESEQKEGGAVLKGSKLTVLWTTSRGGLPTWKKSALGEEVVDSYGVLSGTRRVPEYSLRRNTTNSINF